MAGVQILRVKSNPQRAFRYKLNLVRLCFNKGYDIQTTRALIIFVSFIIALPQTEQKKFEQEIIKTIVMEEKPLIEVDRSTTLLLTRIFFGKPYEELMAEWKAKADRLGRASGRRKAKKEMEKAKKEMEKAKKEMEKSMSERVEELAKARAEELAKARAEELAKARAEELAKARAEELAKARAEELAKKKIERLKKKTKEEQKRTSILQAYFQAGLPVNTISKIFDTDTATIKKIISQAKKKKTEKNGKPPKGSSS
ncbi:MAG TPA: hypothetical protein ENJ20_04520 [Bacteroidetes bacterium]|nr:hypothetical protein [Bacteroidota bacterium]